MCQKFCFAKYVLHKPHNRKLYTTGLLSVGLRVHKCRRTGDRRVEKQIQQQPIKNHVTGPVNEHVQIYTSGFELINRHVA